MQERGARGDPGRHTHCARGGARGARGGHAAGGGDHAGGGRVGRLGRMEVLGMAFCCGSLRQGRDFRTLTKVDQEPGVSVRSSENGLLTYIIDCICLLGSSPIFKGKMS